MRVGVGVRGAQHRRPVRHLRGEGGAGARAVGGPRAHEDVRKGRDGGGVARAARTARAAPAPTARITVLLPPPLGPVSTTARRARVRGRWPARSLSSTGACRARGRGVRRRRRRAPPAPTARTWSMSVASASAHCRRRRARQAPRSAAQSASTRRRGLVERLARGLARLVRARELGGGVLLRHDLALPVARSRRRRRPAVQRGGPPRASPRAAGPRHSSRAPSARALARPSSPTRASRTRPMVWSMASSIARRRPRVERLDAQVQLRRGRRRQVAPERGACRGLDRAQVAAQRVEVVAAPPAAPCASARCAPRSVGSAAAGRLQRGHRGAQLRRVLAA